MREMPSVKGDAECVLELFDNVGRGGGKFKFIVLSSDVVEHLLCGQ